MNNQEQNEIAYLNIKLVLILIFTHNIFTNKMAIFDRNQQSSE